MSVVKVIGTVIIFLFLTILTQIGGVIYLLSLFTYRPINGRVDNRIARGALKLTSFLLLYLIATFIIVPALARPFNRVPLPLTQQSGLKPLTFITCFLNRHYVRPELKTATIATAKRVSSGYPGTVINYLDANFPFSHHFPLFPHLSHNDGRKLDIAFCYVDSRTMSLTAKAPSVIGYGVSEAPFEEEVNTAALCEQQGYWQYSFLQKIVPQGNKRRYLLDVMRTKAIINAFAARPEIGKIFLEPHLKTRFGLSNQKIRFHGCQAVRHDDHVHIQLK